MVQKSGVHQLIGVTTPSVTRFFSLLQWYCWCFRNPIPKPPFGCTLRPSYIMGIYTTFTSNLVSFTRISLKQSTVMVPGIGWDPQAIGPCGGTYQTFGWMPGPYLTVAIGTHHEAPFQSWILVGGFNQPPFEKYARQKWVHLSLKSGEFPSKTLPFGVKTRVRSRANLISPEWIFFRSQMS